MYKINKIINLLKQEFPDFTSPKPSKSDPMDVLIATMLSQNTTDKTSYIAYNNLKSNFNSWEDVMNAPLSKIKRSIKVCGLANQKSTAIKKLLKSLHSKYGKLSLTHFHNLSNDEIYKELLNYDGIGVKTASCVLAFSLGRDVFPVDTHVHRVINRLGIVKASSPAKTFKLAEKVIPNGKKFLFHTLLIRFGRKICKAKNPLCSKCLLYDDCRFSDKELYASKNKSFPKENNFIILEHV